MQTMKLVQSEESNNSDEQIQHLKDMPSVVLVILSINLSAIVTFELHLQFIILMKSPGGGQS